MQLLLLYFDCKCVNLSEFKFRVLMEHSVLGKLLDFYQHDENAQLKDCACICILKNKYRSFFFLIIVYFFSKHALFWSWKIDMHLWVRDIHRKSVDCWDCLYEEFSPPKSVFWVLSNRQLPNFITSFVSFHLRECQRILITIWFYYSFCSRILAVLIMMC